MWICHNHHLNLWKLKLCSAMDPLLLGTEHKTEWKTGRRCIEY